MAALVQCTVAFYPFQDFQLGSLTCAIPGDANVNQLKECLVPLLRREGFLPPTHTAVNLLPVYVFKRGDAPLWSELECMDVVALLHKTKHQNPTTLIDPTLPTTRVQAVAFHPSMPQEQASHVLRSRAQADAENMQPDARLGSPIAYASYGRSDSVEEKKFDAHADEGPLVIRGFGGRAPLRHKEIKPRVTSPSPPPAKRQRLSGSCTSLDQRFPSPFDGLSGLSPALKEIPKIANSDPATTPNRDPATTPSSDDLSSGDGLERPDEPLELEPEPELNQESNRGPATGAEAETGAQDHSTERASEEHQGSEAGPDSAPSILNVPHQFCTESDFPTCLFYGDGQSHCYRYRQFCVDGTSDRVREEIQTCDQELRREVLVKVHAHVSAEDQRTSVTELHQSNPEARTQRWTWKDCRKIGFTACDILHLGRPPVYETSISTIKPLLSKLPEDCPSLEHLHLLRFKSKLDNSDALAPLDLPLHELHLTWSSIAAPSLRALTSGCSHTLRRLCVSITKGLTCKQLAEVLSSMTAIQELSLGVDIYGQEKELIQGGGLRKIIQSCSKCQIQRLSIVYERPLKITPALLTILSNAPLPFRQQLKHLDLTDVIYSSSGADAAWLELFNPNVFPSLKTIACPSLRQYKGNRFSANMTKRAKEAGVNVVRAEKHCGLFHGRLEACLSCRPANKRKVPL